MPTRFSLAQVETAKANLDAIPAADKELREVGLKTTIKTLAPTLRRLASKGYTQQRIIELLRDQDIPISASTLKHYLGPKSVKQAAGGKKRDTTTAASVAHAGVGPRVGEEPAVRPAPGFAPAEGLATKPAPNGATRSTTGPRP